MDNKKKQVGEDDHGELKFYYSREERLRKRHLPSFERNAFLFFRRKRRGLLIIIIDIFLIALVFIFLHKPANVFLQEKKSDLVYELNVTGVKGMKTLVGFTIRNEGERDFAVIPGPVSIRITPRSGDVQLYQKPIEHDTVLQPGESCSTIFLFSDEELPDWGRLELFYGTEKQAFFAKNIRF
jgi:hypothetical protein